MTSRTTDTSSPGTSPDSDSPGVIEKTHPSTGDPYPNVPDDHKKRLDEGSEDPASETESPVPEEVDGGYGWVVVLACHLLNAHTWGINAAYSVFLAHYLRSGAFPGASPLAFAFVGGLSISMALFISPVATVCIRILGTRKTLSIGVVLVTAAFIGASFTSEMWHLILSQGIAFGLGMGFSFVGSVGVTSQWFTRRRSLANGLAAGGSGLGGLIYALAANAMIRNIGLPWAFRVLAVLSFVVNGVCSYLIRDRNKQVGAIHAPFRTELFRRPEYLLLLSWAFFFLLAYIIVVFSLPDYCQTVGLSATQGSVVAALYSLSQGLGRPLIGLASDKFGRINVSVVGTLVACVTAFFIWIFAGKFFAGIIIYALFGAFSGIIWATISPVCAEVIGLQLLPSGLSIVWLIMVLPATFAEAIGLSLRREGQDGYLYVQLFTGLAYLVAFISILLLRGWKLYEIETLGLNKEAREQAIQDNDAAARGSADAAPGPDRSRPSLLSYLMQGKWLLSTARV